ncbi:hypothetical protein ABPG77_005026 [Micractinium sp. CCAP 211/92]
MLGGRRLLALGFVLALAGARAQEDDVVAAMIGEPDPLTDSLVAAQARFGRSIYSCLEQTGCRLMAQLIRAIDMQQYFGNPNAVTTFLAPTDQAVNAFLSVTGKTLQQLQNDKQLIFRLLQYHSLARAHRTSYFPAAGNDVKKAVTLVPGLFLTLYTDAKGGYHVGALENSAQLVRGKYDLVCGMSVFHVINQVLRPFLLAG